MDDPNITMKEYIRIEEEKAQKDGKMFNWETAKYGKIWFDKDVLNLRSVETEFPAIVFNDSLTSSETPSCEPTVSSPNDEIDFRISFDESKDEDYTIVFDKNSFSYKIIPTNDLKTDSKNDNEKVNKPSFPSPKPEVSYSNDLDFFKDFKNEFPAIVYNDALMSKSDFLTEHIVLEDASPRKDEINKDKSKCGRSFRLFVIAVPTRTDVPEYQKLTSQVHEIVGRINGRFGTLTTVPIHHLDRSLDFLALCALYAVTGTDPLPLYITVVVASIGQALTMSSEESEKHHLHNFLHVTTQTAQNWAETFVSELNDTVVEAQQRTRQVPPPLPVEEAIERSESQLKYAKMQGNDEEDELEEEEDEEEHRDTLCGACGETTLQMNSGSAVIYCMIWEESAIVTASVNAVEMINPLNEHAIILVKKVGSEEHFHEVRKPSLNIHTYIPKANSEGELQVKVLFLHNSNYNSKLSEPQAVHLVAEV
ncbi:putative reverse transcriptase domain-containing protein [Tanacetum coccineum]